MQADAHVDGHVAGGNRGVQVLDLGVGVEDLHAGDAGVVLDGVAFAGVKEDRSREAVDAVCTDAECIETQGVRVFPRGVHAEAPGDVLARRARGVHHGGGFQRQVVARVSALLEPGHFGPRHFDGSGRGFEEQHGLSERGARGAVDRVGAGHLVDLARGVEANRVAADGHGAVVAGRGADAKICEAYGTTVAGVHREGDVRRTRALGQRHALIQFAVEAVGLVEGALPVVQDVEVTDHKRTARRGIKALKFEAEGHPLVAVVVLEGEGHLRVVQEVVDGVGQADRRPSDGGHDARRVRHGAEVFAQTTDSEHQVEALTCVGRGVNGVLIEDDVRGRDGRTVGQHEAAADRLRSKVQRHRFAVHTGVHVANLGVVEHGLTAKRTEGGLVKGPVDVTVVGQVHANVVGVVSKAEVEPNF